jgi:REP element-mobilizing transposase RayT
MARPLRVQYSGACYHVMARGQRRETIFTDDVDCARFMEVLDEALDFYDARLHAYCLMGNH